VYDIYCTVYTNIKYNYPPRSLLCCAECMPPIKHGPYTIYAYLTLYVRYAEGRYYNCVNAHDVHNIPCEKTIRREENVRSSRRDVYAKTYNMLLCKLIGCAYFKRKYLIRVRILSRRSWKMLVFYFDFLTVTNDFWKSIEKIFKTFGDLARNRLCCFIPRISIYI